MKHPSIISVNDYLDQPQRFSCVLDARTPAEYALDHLPHAHNTPVLSNEQRILIGTLDKQVSSFDAKREGAKWVSRNIANLLDTDLFNQSKDWTPLIYCWRGGNRSGSLTHVLRKIGWHSCQLEGGYKAFRTRVIQDLESLPQTIQFRVVAGPTGVGKTKLLQSIAKHGGHILDLEHLASHKGSLLGGTPIAQPSQKAFETHLWRHLRQFPHHAIVFVECESATIGSLRVPETLLNQIRNSPCIHLHADLATRVALLQEDYQHFILNPDRLLEKLLHLTPIVGHRTINAWRELITHQQWHTLIEHLLLAHYDPVYQRSLVRNFKLIQEADTVMLSNPGTANFDAIAQQLLEQVKTPLQ